MAMDNKDVRGATAYVLKGREQINIKKFVLKYNTVIIFFVMVVISNIVSSAFLSKTNVFNLLRQVSGLGIISLGMMLVIITGGIDLSVGSMMAFTSVLSAHLIAKNSMDFYTAAIFTIVTGFFTGTVFGYLVAYRKMAPFVATLAQMTITRGFAFILSKGTPIMVENAMLASIADGYLLGIPVLVYIMAFIFVIVCLVQKYTVFGRMLIAIGSNEEVVRLSGIKVGIYKLLVYSISGAFCAIAGIISTSRTGVGSPVVGSGYELDAIAAVVIGGASITGGKGSAFNSIIGVLVLGMIGNIMNLLNIAAYPQQVIKGIIIILAVLSQGVGSAKNS